MDVQLKCKLSKGQGVELMQITSSGHSNTKADLEQKVEEWIQEAFEEGMRVGKFWKDKETR